MLLLAVVVAICIAGAAGSLPTRPPQALTFLDTDLDEFEIGGLVEFVSAVDESDITYYALYFGSSATTVLSPLANLPVPGLTQVNLGTNFPLPAGASHFLVYSANSNGVAWSQGTSCILYDKAIPVNAPLGLVFQDTDLELGELGGSITVARAASEVDVSHYAVYFGSSATTLLQVVPGAFLGKAVDPVVAHVASDTTIPTGATHLLAYTYNLDGLNAVPAAITLYDSAVPQHAATSVQFVDADMGFDEVSGVVTIGKATDESIISGYAVYFASGASGPIDSLIGVAPSTGSDVTLIVPADTPIPFGVTHLLVRTQSVDGDMDSGTSVLLDDKAIPVNPPTDLQFDDLDIDRDELGGTITISSATDESDILYYSVFFGDAYYVKIGSEITNLAKGPSVLTYSFANGLPLPSGAAFLMALAGNADGVALPANGRIIALVDHAVPLNPPVNIAFTDQDSDPGEIGGTVTVQRAIDESDVTAYSCYWGSSATADASSRLSATPIETVSTAGLSSSYAVCHIGHNSPIPGTATHFLAFSANADGDMRTGISVLIVDRTDDFPTVTVQSVLFTDVDLDMDEIGGPVFWSEPANKAGILTYSVYVAVDSAGTLRQYLGSAPVGDTSFSMPVDLALYQGLGSFYTHVLVYTNNFWGEALTGLAEPIVDRALPTALAVGATFLDNDPAQGSIGGTVSWTAPSNPALPTAFLSFTVYLAEATDGSGSFFLGEVSLPMTTLTFASGVALANYTHVIVYTKNAAGQALVGAAALIVDLWLPPEPVTYLLFFDEDLGDREIGGTVSWIEPSDTAVINVYRVYLVDPDSGMALLGEVAKGSASLTVPFDTATGNATELRVVAANDAGEALFWANITLEDRTADSCPTDVGHGHASPRWRIVAGPVSTAWRVKAIRFYEDAHCTSRLATVPLGWPRRPRQTEGEPFANPPSPVNLYEIFRIPERRYTFNNGTALPLDPDAGPWWTSGGPCLDLLNATLAAPTDFDPAASACFLGFGWDSNTFVKDRRVVGSTGLVIAAPKKVHCAQLEQSEAAGEFAQHVALQWFDTSRSEYRTLMKARTNAGGSLQFAYQPVLATECAIAGAGGR